MIPLNAASCVFPAGPDIALADLALRTNCSKVRRHPFYVDRCGQRVTASYFNDPETAFDLPRWQALTEAVLIDLQTRLDHLPEKSLQQAPWQAWLVLPDPNRPGVPKDLAHALLPTLDSWPYELQGVEAIFGGHASGIKAIEAATQACAADPKSIALILAVDSQLSHETLMWLEELDLLHGARKLFKGHPRQNAYGRLPGEGAAALVLSQRRDLPAWCSITGLALGEERCTYDQPKPCVGQGLTFVAQQAIANAAQLQQRKIRHLCHDYNGEPYRADEYGFTALRLADQLDPDHTRNTPALVSGDLGAASAITHTALAAWSSHKRSDEAAHLILASSDDPLRGALVLYEGKAEAS
jgi:3-oxoacyl-[acyl-carrier-protein] synthase-1